MATGSWRGARALGFATVLVLTVGSAADLRAEEPIVIVLSWDGVRHDYLDRGHFPALKRIEQQGIRAERLIPVFPSSTFPNHVALATGTHTDRHGIMNNVFRDSERGLYSYSTFSSLFFSSLLICSGV